MAGNATNSVQMIRALLEGQRFTEAEVAAARLAQQHPEPRTAVLQAQVAGRVRGPEAALALLHGAAVRFPASPEVQTALAQAAMAAKRFDEAAAAYGRLLEARPSDGNLLYARAVALAQGTNPGAALPIFDSLIRARPEMAELHYNRGLALKAAGQPEAAEAAYREAVRRDPALLPAWLNLGNLLLDLGRVPEAFEAFRTRYDSARARGAAPDDPDLATTSAAKLRHDLEQLRHLDALGKLDAGDRGLIDAYAGVLAEIERLEGDRVPLTRAQRDRLGGTYQRVIRMEPGAAIEGPVLNPALDLAAIQAAYLGEGQEVAVVDDVLTAEALAALRTFLNDSSVWHQWKFARDHGYLGARMADGFSCPLILQIAEAFRTALPGIFRHHTLRTLWAFKHSERIEGVPIHADFAAVNVNLYITPNEANLDPETGGLMVWPVKAPPDWEFSKYNTDAAALERLVTASGVPPIRAAHRQNRIVIFNSDYAHKTDELHFKPGYLNRRINVTMLFGRREGA